jgi:hypothetical protein
MASTWIMSSWHRSARPSPGLRQSQGFHEYLPPSADRQFDCMDQIITEAVYVFPRRLAAMLNRPRFSRSAYF